MEWIGLTPQQMANDCLVERKCHPLILQPDKGREALKEGGVSPKYLPRGPFGWRVPRETRKTIVYGALEYHLSFPGLLGQARIRGGWREVKWQKASVLELVGLAEKKV